MSRVFLSHSRWDSRQAIAVKAWLVEQEPGLTEEIYLDVDPHTGIRPGARWKQALQQANARCEVVICLLSAQWEASPECKTEFRYAETLNKAILVARLEPVPDTNITSEWQRCDLFVGEGPTTKIPIDGGEPVVLSTEGLARLRNGLRALGIGADYFPWPPLGDPDRAPYRGWAPLEEADAAVFFGRDAQIVQGLDELRGMRATGVKSLLVILGPSGSGKSSFLRAGLLPRLRRDDRQFLPMDIVRPERAVLNGELGLAQAIHELRVHFGLNHPLLGEIKNACHPDQVERLRGWLDEARQVARARLLDVPAEQPAPTMVLPVDQGEELFNADAGPEAARFLELLASLVEHEAGVTPAMIVAVTIRADRYEPLQTAPELAGVHAREFGDLKPMPPAGYSEVITGPARRATAAGRRLAVEPALVDRLLGETSEGADALPLLALTLERLYRDFGADGDLTVAEYEALGGMAQVVQTEVDNLLASDPEARQTQLDILHDAFIPWLATINPDNDQPMRRLARWDDLPAASRPLIQAMVEKRLLVKDTRDGQTVVEVALESLLRQWRELAAWLRDEAQDLKDADTLERAAADWQASGRNDSWLLEGTRLAEAETLAAKPGFRDRLDTTRDYLNASRKREEQRLADERRRHEAELQAARQSQEAAEALAAAESQAKRDAEEHAAVLRKRARILRGVLAVTVVIATVAVLLFVQANNARRQADTARGEADTRAREATALRLTSQGESMLAGTQGGGDSRAVQQILAAQQIAATADEGAMFTAVVKLAHTLKIIDTHAWVVSVAFSPDGTRIASGGLDNPVRLWDAATGQPVGQPMGDQKYVVSDVAFSPDGTRIASASGDGTIRLWDARTGQPVGQPMTGHTDYVKSVTFSPDGTRIASGSGDGTIRLWDARTGQPVGQPMGDQKYLVNDVAFSLDGTRIASASEDGTIRLWDAHTGQPVGQPMTGHTAYVKSVAFSPDGTRIASGSADHTVRLWDAATGQPVGQPMTGHTDYVNSVAFSPDGTRIASGSADRTLRLWDAHTGLPLGQPMTGHTERLISVAFSPDGTRIASGSADHTVRVWDAAIGQPMTGHTDQVASMAFSPDGTRIASGSADHTVRLWDAHTGQPLGHPMTGHLGTVDNVAFSPDGTRIASGGADATIRLWDAHTGQPDGQPLTGHQGPVNSVAFSPDGTRIASGSQDHTVRLWDAHTGRQFLHVLTGHTDRVNSVAFSPDGHRIVSGSYDKTVRLWDADTGKPIGDPLTGHTNYVTSVAFSPDGTRIASASADGTIRLWDARTGQPVGQPLTGHQGPVAGVAFSPDGTRIASASIDNTVRLWDAHTGQPVGQPLTGHLGTVWGVAFSPDGKRIASGGDDKTIRVWPGYADTTMLCANLTANMSHQQWRDWVSPDIDYIKVCPDLPVAPD